MNPIAWIALVVFLLFGPSTAGYLLYRRLTERRYINVTGVMPQDVPDGNGEWL